MQFSPVTVLVIGCGARGALYSKYALEHPDKMKVIGVAEPRSVYRDIFVKEHDIESGNIFSSWQDAAAIGKIADAVIISTPDHLHTLPTLAFSKLKYAILLEKPISPSEEECKQITQSIEENNNIFSVCHVLRYTRYTAQLKELLSQGAIGEIVNMQHLEPVGWWHQAHSFVRGNWNNESDSTFMLLAKACHDLDWIRFVMGVAVTSVHSFGGLYHFKKENHPTGAGEYCLDCDIEESCPYSAKRIYLDREYGGEYFKKIISPDLSNSAIEENLKDGPYGRCVYLCNNDVVDHQVVNMQFEGNKSASFTMTAFTEYTDRKTRIFGTHGCIEGDGKLIKVFNFNQDKETVYDVDALNLDSTMTGHGGGDYYLMKSFIDSVANQDQSLNLSGAKDSLETHLTVFAAEHSRKNNCVVNITVD